MLAYSKQQPRQSVRRIQALGSEMGLRVVELRALEAVARELGGPVPERLRPARTREQLPMTLSPRPRRFADGLAPSGPRPYLKDHATVPALYLGACIGVYITLLTRW